MSAPCSDQRLSSWMVGRRAFDARSSNTTRLLGLGQCLHAWPEPGAAEKAFPGRASVAVTGEAGLGYMLGNLEVLLREKLGITVVHSSNGGFVGYGPGFWGQDTIPSHTRCWARRGGYVEGDRRPRLPHRAGERASRGHPGPAADAQRQ